MTKYGWLIVIVLTLIAVVYAYVQLLKPLDVFLWDESHHGLYGMQIYNDLRSGDWGAFWAHTNSQALWMPLHSWFDGIFLLLFGFSYASARLSSLFLFFGCSLLLYALGLELSKEKGWLVGLFACVMFLTSPMMLHFATVNMQEMLGIFICLLTVYFIVRNIALNAVWHYVMVGFLISVAFWAKQNFAIAIALGIALFYVSLLWEGRREPAEAQSVEGKAKKKKKQPKAAGLWEVFTLKSQQNRFLAWGLKGLYLVLGFLPLFVLWWATPPFDRKYALAVTFRQGSVGGDAAGHSFISGLIGSALYYLQSFLTSYHLSFLLALGSLAAVSAALFFFSDKKIRIISLIFYANWLFVSLLSSVQERWSSLAVPLVFLLSSYFGLLAIERLTRKRTIALAVYVGLAFLVLSFVYDLAYLTRYTKEVSKRSMFSFIYKDSLNGFSPPFLFGLAGRPAMTYPQDFTKSKNREFKVPPNSTIQDVLAYFSANIARDRSISSIISYCHISPYVIYWHFNDWLAPVCSVNDLGVNPRNFWSADYFIDIQAAADSPYYPDWLDKGWLELGPKLLRGGYIKQVAAKEYPDLGLTARIYQRTRDIVPR